ncbi:Protein TBATA [Triplophysa tibetana]|uniref:Protein TBATA n=1 Tax=Triplophysa tibetana TaxID=1572043 RepID=A0A5A9PSY6_9TELE|nr:Protein TBATA [Triplophysa tibetana]
MMETSDERTSCDSVLNKNTREKLTCDTPGTSRINTRNGVRFGTLSHHSFFSRHNPHPHRVRHMQGLNGKPVCTVNDDWYGFTPLCPHPLIKSQVPAIRSPDMSPDSSTPRSVFLSESWREELKDLAAKVRLTAENDNEKNEKLMDEEAPRRMTQYSAQSGRIIPSTSWGKKRSRTSHRRLGTQRRQTQPLEGMELRVRHTHAH